MRALTRSKFTNNRSESKHSVLQKEQYNLTASVEDLVNGLGDLTLNNLLRERDRFAQHMNSDEPYLEDGISRFPR